MTTELLGNTTFKPTDDVTWRDVSGEMVVLKLSSGEYYTFNEQGRITWLALSEGKSMEQAVRMVVDEYDVSSDKAREDVEAFVVGLMEQELLDRQAETGKEARE
jgi:hypothetical protein